MCVSRDDSFVNTTSPDYTPGLLSFCYPNSCPQNHSWPLSGCLPATSHLTPARIFSITYQNFLVLALQFNELKTLPFKFYLKPSVCPRTWPKFNIFRHTPMFQLDGINLALGYSGYNKRQHPLPASIYSLSNESPVRNA